VVTRIAAINDGEYDISRFVSTDSVFANDTAIGNDEAGFYVGDPLAHSVIRDSRGLAVGWVAGVPVGIASAWSPHRRVRSHARAADVSLPGAATGTAAGLGGMSFLAVAGRR
jgi:hypothetical protein